MRPIRVDRHIAAPPESVLDVILDVDRYPVWNRFTRRIEHALELNRRP